MVPLPNLGAAIANNLGKLLQPWVSYLQQFTQAPPDFADVSLGGSPFLYIAKEPGTIFVSGGTVSSITLTRGRITIIIATSTATPRLIPVGIEDSVSVTYSVLPTIQFIPAYGQNTTS